jgi:4-amino-4-deoxy-L-arabinose transferase-like glycosyltransferase
MPPLTPATPNAPVAAQPPLRRRMAGALEHLCAALTDPARCERNVLVVLAFYVAIWTLYGVIAKASQDLHFDMTEIVGWAREPALGYPKHPPLAAYVVRLWFLVFPYANASYYLLAIALAALSLWFAWKIAGDYLDAEKRVIALALLTLIPFFNFHALKFNVNTVLMPVWAATTWWFLRSFERRNQFYAVLAGIGAGLAMLGKYWSIFLLLGLVLAALIDRRRALYFRSAAPYLTVLAGLIVIAPHAVWLVTHDFLTFAYATAAHAPKGLGATLIGALGYLGGAAGYVAAPVLLALILLRVRATAFADMLWPKTDARRLVAIAFYAPLLLPPVVALAAGLELTSLWTMSAWSLLPVVLLSSPQVEVPKGAGRPFLAIAVAVPLVMTAAAPVIALSIHKAGVAPAQAHAKLLARQVARMWRMTTDKPLRLVGGDADLSYGAAFYLRGKPSAFPGLNPALAPWVDATRLAREGIAIVCRKDDAPCVAALDARLNGVAAARREEVVLARRFLGFAGVPQTYVIAAIPPR